MRPDAGHFRPALERNCGLRRCDIRLQFQLHILRGSKRQRPRSVATPVGNPGRNPPTARFGLSRNHAFRSNRQRLRARFGKSRRNAHQFFVAPARNRQNRFGFARALHQPASDVFQRRTHRDDCQHAQCLRASSHADAKRRQRLPQPHETHLHSGKISRHRRACARTHSQCRGHDRLHRRVLRRKRRGVREHTARFSRDSFRQRFYVRLFAAPHHSRVGLAGRRSGECQERAFSAAHRLAARNLARHQHRARRRNGRSFG